MMKKLYLILLFFASAGFGYGQTTIAFQGFETGDNWSLTNGVTYISNDVGSADTPASARIRTGSSSWQVNNTTGTLVLGSIDVSSYSSVKITVHISSTSTTSRNGADGGDYIKIYANVGGGFPSIADIELDGNTNARWDYAATLTKSTTAGTSVTVTAPQGGTNTTNYATLEILIPTDSNTVALKLVAQNNSSDEIWNIDDITLTGSNDQTSEVDAPTTQIAGTSISSLDDTQGEAIDVFKMTIKDTASGDGLPTHVTNIRVKPNTTNTADWTNTIQGVTLNDGSAVTIGTPTITDAYIDMPITSGGLDIPDGGSKDVTLAVYLNTSNIVDGDVLSFFVDAANHGFTADASGSDFASIFSGGDFHSNDFTITVVGTQFTYFQQPSNVIIDVAMSPLVQVGFTDVNGNTDIDENGTSSTVTLSTTGIFSNDATTSIDAVNGIATFDNLKFSATGTGVTITAIDADSGEMSSLVSNSFDINPPKVIIARNCDPHNNFALDRFAEIYNAGNSSVDLSSWTLENIQTGSVAFTWTLSGTINPGQTKVCGNASASGQTITPDFTATWNGTSWNGKGNDGTILKDNNSEVIDNAVQSDATGTFENKEMKRKLSITSPNATYTASEWIFSAVVDALDVVPGFHGTVWRGTGTVWSTSNNWDAEVPTLTSDVTIPSGVTTYPSIDNSISSPANCNDLTIQTNASLTIPAGKALSVNGTLTNNATATGLVIQSDATGNGSLIVSGSVTGDATVQRYIVGYTAAGDGWHEIGCPVTSFDPGSTDWASGSGNSNDLYYWDESQNLWMNYRDVPFTFVPEKGYLVAYVSDLTHVFTGTLNNTDVTVSGLTYTSGKGEGWNLLGNPFPCAVKWNDGNWTLTNLASGTAKVWDYASNPGNYSDVTSNGIIPSTNGFFVQVSSGTTGSVTIPTAARLHDATNNYKNMQADSPNESLRFRITNDENGYTDIATLGFRADATNQMDWAFDSHKLFGDAQSPQLWTVSDNEMFSTDYLPYSIENIEVPLSFKAGVNSTYHLTFSGIDSFAGASDIYLEDLALSKTINLKNQSVYDFTATTEDANNRFLLHFYNVTAVPQIAKPDNQALIYSYNNRIVLKSNGKALNGQVEVVNLLGQTVYSKNVEQSNLFTINVPLHEGVYIVRYAQTGGTVQTGKVVLK